MDIISLPEWRRTMHIEAEHTVKDCEGCRAAILTGDRYCSGCGADQNDLFGRILAVNLDDVQPFTTDPHWDDKHWDEMAKDVRAFFKQMGFKGCRARMSKSYCWNVEIGVPSAHGKDVYTHDEFGPLAFGRDKTCAACARQHEATLHLGRILYRAFPTSSDKTDLMTDYHDATFYLWGHA